MSRIDDIINVAGHRLSTGSIEEALAGHPDVAECAVIGAADEMKGEVPVGFVVLKAGVTRTPTTVVGELVERVRSEHRRVCVLQDRAGREGAAEDAVGQDPARHDEEDRGRRGVHAAGHDRRSWRARRYRIVQLKTVGYARR